MFDGVLSEFAAIRAPGTNLVRVKRAPSQALRAAVRRCLMATETDFRTNAKPEGIDAALAACGVDPVLAAAMAGLARDFARATEAPALAMRFERITGPGCKLFHVDWVACRLITTYAGAGTEILDDAQVDRARLGQGGNAGIMKPGAVADRLETFEIGLFKGEAWPGNRDHGIVHRSPRATNTRPRLVFVVDALFAPAA